MFKAIACPRSFALLLSVQEVLILQHLTQLALSHFPSHSSNTRSQRPFLILYMSNRSLPDTLVCYCLIYHFYSTDTLSFQSFVCLFILYFPHETVSSWRAGIHSVSFMPLSLGPSTVSGIKYILNTYLLMNQGMRAMNWEEIEREFMEKVTCKPSLGRIDIRKAQGEQVALGIDRSRFIPA